jgi:RNA polymerase sigma-70 factor, ECF subfamily
MEGETEEVTQLLLAWSNGETSALDRLMPLVYDHLRRLARFYMRREATDHSLQTTALIHEAYLKLVDQQRAKWHNRAHFYAICAQLMRRILVDMARTRQARRRGGAVERLSLESAPEIASGKSDELIALDEALRGLTALDERKGRIVELRFFGGLSVEETAEVLKVSPATVMREWKRAQAWLYCEMAKAGPAGAS